MKNFTWEKVNGEHVKGEKVIRERSNMGKSQRRR